jgi:hypothetical protein
MGWTISERYQTSQQLHDLLIFFEAPGGSHVIGEVPHQEDRDNRGGLDKATPTPLADTGVSCRLH